jgi:hypothetical protein
MQRNSETGLDLANQSSQGKPQKPEDRLIEFQYQKELQKTEMIMELKQRKPKVKQSPQSQGINQRKGATNK